MKRQSGTLRRRRRWNQVSAGNWGPASVKCKWKAEFGKRQQLDYKTENTPYFQWRAKSVEDDENPEAAEGESVGDEPEESFVRMFMSGLDESDVCQPQADKIEEFCSGATLQQLCAESDKSSLTLPPVAWLDESGMKGGTLCSRPSRGALTARGLYHELKKPVGVLYFRGKGINIC